MDPSLQLRRDYPCYISESIAAQTVSDFEVIIVNDGSKDATADVLQGSANMDSRFSFITIPTNGPGNARNQGIARAQGRYLFLMDADDEIEQHTLERYQTILTGEAPDLIVASYNLRVLDNQEIVSKNKSSPKIEPTLRTRRSWRICIL